MNEYKMVANDIVLEDDKAWFVENDLNVLVEVDLESGIGHIVSYLDKGINYFNSIIKINDEIYAIPSGMGYIHIYNIKTQIDSRINLELDNTKTSDIFAGYFKLWNPIFIDGKLFISGFEYPGVVVVDTNCKKIDYIDRSTTKTENYRIFDAMDNHVKGFSGSGWCIINNMLILPSKVFSGFISIDPHTNEISTIEVKGGGGFNSISCNFELIVAENDKGNIVIMTTDYNIIKEIEFPKQERRGYFFAFFPPLLSKDKAYLFPFESRDIYEIDLNKMEYKLSKLNSYISDESREAVVNTVYCAKSVDNRMLFADYATDRWIIIDEATEKIKELVFVLKADEVCDYYNKTVKRNEMVAESNNYGLYNYIETVISK